MDLWIRSQNKEIFRKSNYLKLEKHDDEWAIVEQATLYGKYKTKERALEVLDDIQKCITLKTLKTDSNYEVIDLYIKAKILESIYRIYEMPKE